MWQKNVTKKKNILHVLVTLNIAWRRSLRVKLDIKAKGGQMKKKIYKWKHAFLWIY